MIKKREGVWTTIPLCVMWILWRERNSRCFEGEVGSFDNNSSLCDVGHMEIEIQDVLKGSNNFCLESQVFWSIACIGWTRENVNLLLIFS